jgi:hypothetical protein
MKDELRHGQARLWSSSAGPSRRGRRLCHDSLGPCSRQAVPRALLGCNPDVLTQLRLCSRAGAALPSRTAADDVVEIAARFGSDAALRGEVCSAWWACQRWGAR